MIITRTPYRISLFGGGSDFPSWYLNESGKVLAFSIDKYCYLTARKLPPFFTHQYRVAYSKTEEIFDLDEMSHPAFREAIRHYGCGSALEIHHHGDLPARSGVGSSSAFAVGLILALNKLHGKSLSKIQTANEAIRFEQEILGENVGSQDQITCAIGGINRINFSKDESWEINKVILPQSTLTEIENRSVLIYTGISRISSDLSHDLAKGSNLNSTALHKSMALVESASMVLERNEDLDQIGLMLHEGWKLKQEINPLSTRPEIQDLINRAVKAGALGGKVLGAGGGGFCLFWLKKDSREDFINKFGSGLIVPFKIDQTGAEIIFESNEIEYSSNR
jgi:D-glycero-alpha-D-manno-heptose-7-phosphate kinase